MFNEVFVSIAFSFVSKKLRVNYGILDVHQVTAGVVKLAMSSKDYVLRRLKNVMLFFWNLCV